MPRPPPDTWSITELAREFDVTTRTIRFYEDRGLLAPARDGARRIYSRSDRTRLKLVLRGKRLGWPLEEIGEMIRLYDAPGGAGERRQLELMLERIVRSRATLVRQRKDIELALGEFDEIEARCRARLDAGAPAGTPSPSPLDSPQRKAS